MSCSNAIKLGTHRVRAHIYRIYLNIGKNGAENCTILCMYTKQHRRQQCIRVKSQAYKLHLHIPHLKGGAKSHSGCGWPDGTKCAPTLASSSQII